MKESLRFRWDRAKFWTIKISLSALQFVLCMHQRLVPRCAKNPARSGKNRYVSLIALELYLKTIKRDFYLEANISRHSTDSFAEEHSQRKSVFPPELISTLGFLNWGVFERWIPSFLKKILWSKESVGEGFFEALTRFIFIASLTNTNNSLINYKGNSAYIFTTSCFDYRS